MIPRNNLFAVGKQCSNQLLMGKGLIKIEIPIFASSNAAAQEKIPSQYGEPKQVWVENLSTIKAERKGIIDLHPEVFGVYPRIDIIHDNLEWQRKYNVVNYAHCKSVHEMIYMYGGGAKPWPQKGTGRARQGSTRAPQWVEGGKSKGPKGPKSMYYMLSYHKRVYGLIHTLSVKVAQDDLRVVENLDIPVAEPAYLQDLLRERGWPKSCLLIDSQDVFPQNITTATEDIPYINLMPLYGLNVNGMLHHENLVLTERAVSSLTEKLLFALHRTDTRERKDWNREGPTKMKLKLETHRPLV